MSSPQDQERERDPHGVPAQDSGPGEPAEAGMRQRHAQAADVTGTAMMTTAVTSSDRVTPAYSLRSAAFLLSPRPPKKSDAALSCRLSSSPLISCHPRW